MLRREEHQHRALHPRTLTSLQLGSPDRTPHGEPRVLRGIWSGTGLSGSLLGEAQWVQTHEL